MGFPIWRCIRGVCHVAIANIIHLWGWRIWLPSFSLFLARFLGSLPRSRKSKNKIFQSSMGSRATSTLQVLQIQAPVVSRVGELAISFRLSLYDKLPCLGRSEKLPVPLKHGTNLGLTVSGPEAWLGWRLVLEWEAALGYTVETWHFWIRPYKQIPVLF